MKSSRSLMLKTYGKKRRQLSAWISPDNRKRAFDSTLSDNDVFVPESAKPASKRETKKSVVSQRAARTAKKKAMLCLMESSSDENIDVFSHPSTQPAQQGKTKRETTIASSRAVCAAQRKAVNVGSSDEENISRPSLACPQPAQRNKTTRKSRHVSLPRVLTRLKGQHTSMTSESDEDSVFAPKCRKKSVCMKKGFNVHPPSVGRFVTCRRHEAAIKPKRSKAKVSTHNSSDDFTSGDFYLSGILQPSRRRKAPLAVLVTSAENSMNTTGTSALSTNPLREISLNELVDNNLGPCHRKPIFCSTPSAGSYNKHPHLKLCAISDKSSISPSISMSYIGPTELPSVEKLQSSIAAQEPDLHHHEEPSGDFFIGLEGTNMGNSCMEEAKSHSQDSKIKGGGKLTSLILLSTKSESSSDFVSAAGGLEWLINALRKECLTKRCTVQLERLDSLTLTQLCSQTTYSSCLGLSSSVHSQQTNIYPLCMKNSQSPDSKFSDHLQLINSFESPKGTVSVINSSLSADCKLSEYSSTSLQDTDKSEKDQTCDIESTGDLTCSRETAEGEMLSLRCSVISSSVVVQKRPIDPEMEEKVQMLKNKCLSDKLAVNINRLTLSELKEILQLKDKTLASSSGGSASDEQLKNDHLSENDTNLCHEDTYVKVNMKKRSLNSSEHRILSDNGKVVQSSRSKIPKRKKLSLAPKEKRRRSRSPDRAGTSRKACVSGLSVSRWKNKGDTSTHVWGGGVKAVDCSINELGAMPHKQPRIGTYTNLSTPQRAGPLNLSSLLPDFTPNTHTWSRLKAALSVHRKILLTPRGLHLSDSPGGAALADISQDLFATPLRTPLHRHFQTKLYHNSLVACEDADLSDAEKVYAECGQQHPLLWEECILPHRMKRCVKIGEGTFGEVFSTVNTSGDTVALKIIPVEGSEIVNGEDQKTFGEILHEIIISKELSSLKEKQQNQTHSFIGLRDLHCVRGCYPPDFLNAWDRFDQQKGSENDRPDFFENDQLFIILEFEFGGIDLENSNGTMASLVVAKSILHQVTAALAVAEEELQFEHRDLHWGNVLVKTTKLKTWSFLLNGVTHSVETKGVLVRIIDYSLSRLAIDDLTVSCDISKDEELFMGQGDYQFDIYRLMRQENGNNWSNFHPHTNVLWLHYLCSKLLSMKYRGPGGRGAKDTREELTRFYDNVLQYSSATEALKNCPMFQ